MKAKSLQDLEALRRTLASEQARLAAQAAARLEAQRAARAAKNLFADAVGPVRPLARPAPVPLARERPAPLALQHERDEQAALREAIGDEFDPGSLLDTDGELSFLRHGVGADVTRKLRRGEWSIQRQIDLHGLRTDEAREVLAAFIRDAHRQGLRCVRVVHGKGLGSPGRTPVLKLKVHRWLAQRAEVMAFVQARPADGGAGALVVLLRPAGR